VSRPTAYAFLTTTKRSRRQGIYVAWIRSGDGHWQQVAMSSDRVIAFARLFAAIDVRGGDGMAVVLFRDVKPSATHRETFKFVNGRMIEAGSA
jgi:hypothetical protein